MCATNESIKRLNGSSTHKNAETPPAKEAKLGVTSEAGSTNQAKLAVYSHDRSEPDRESDRGSDGDMLLSNENNEANMALTERTHDAIPEKTCRDRKNAMAPHKTISS